MAQAKLAQQDAKQPPTVSRKLDIEAEAAASLLANLRTALDEDETLKLDMLEGETGLLEAVDSALDRLQEIDSFADAIKARMDDLRARKERLTRQADMIRAALASAMEMAEVKKLERPEATISVKAVPASAVVLDELEIPSDYWTPQPPKLDKRALLDALKQGPVAGATLSNGGTTISIRGK